MACSLYVSVLFLSSAVFQSVADQPTVRYLPSTEQLTDKVSKFILTKVEHLVA